MEEYNYSTTKIKRDKALPVKTISFLRKATLQRILCSTRLKKYGHK